MRNTLLRSALVVTLFTATLPTLYAQQNLTMPQASPAASVSQTVGLSKMEITYHRPAVKGRTIWGGLVPFDKVWRAGANENTTISFDTDVTINGQPLPAGTYGLHTIPTAKDWTVIFSKDARAWGSYAYDQTRDALRINVTPETKADSVERLTFTFDDVTDDGATVALRWEKLRVPFQVKIDLPKSVLANIRQELTGLQQFNWQPWSQAANYAVRNGGDLDEAMRWADKAVAMNRNFSTLRAKAAVAEKKGDAAAATALRAEALKLATPADLNSYGAMLAGQKKYDEAIDALKKSAAANATGSVYFNLGNAYAGKGDKKAALDAYNKALGMTQDEDDRRDIEAAIAKLK
jgi:hypothetical protein